MFIYFLDMSTDVPTSTDLPEGAADVSFYVNFGRGVQWDAETAGKLLDFVQGDGVKALLDVQGKNFASFNLGTYF